MQFTALAFFSLVAFCITAIFGLSIPYWVFLVIPFIPWLVSLSIIAATFVVWLFVMIAAVIGLMASEIHDTIKKAIK